MEPGRAYLDRALDDHRQYYYAMERIRRESPWPRKPCNIALRRKMIEDNLIKLKELAEIDFERRFALLNPYVEPEIKAAQDIRYTADIARKAFDHSERAIEEGRSITLRNQELRHLKNDMRKFTELTELLADHRQKQSEHTSQPPAQNEN